MSKNQQIPQDQVFWNLNTTTPQQLRHPIKSDIVIVGGGIAGLSAAQGFHEKGCSVVLLEKTFCGAGASGKSSGFITPDSELNLNYFDRVFGAQTAQTMWNFVLGGVELIKHNIQKSNLDCDYQVQDTLVVANSARASSKIKQEHQTRQKLSYQSTWYDKDNLSNVIGSKKYYSGVRYSQTFGINAYRYCQEMKVHLESNGVKIFEEAPVIKIHKHGVDTPYTTVNADHVIVCIDRFLPDLGALSKDVYHAQTFLMMSAPLNDDEIKRIFPEERLMVWDTDLVYQYYRISGDNRFMIGGSNLISIFWGKEQHNSKSMFEKLSTYAKKNFPQVTMHFEYFWPGLIGVSKDIMPLAGHDIKNPHVYYISGAAGLPWAAALGNYAAEKIINNKNDFDEYFSLQRKFPVGAAAQYALGKRLTFALSNLITLHG